MKRLLSILLIALFSTGCEGKKEKSMPSSDEGIYNVEIIQKNYETKSFELWAGELISKNDTTWGKNIKVIFFDPSGDTSSVLYAKKGWYVEKTGNVGAEGDVKVYAKRGDTLFTDELLYIDSKREIHAPEHVTIYRNGQKIEGRELVSDVNFRKVEIGGKVVGKED